MIDACRFVLDGAGAIHLTPQARSEHHGRKDVQKIGEGRKQGGHAAQGGRHLVGRHERIQFGARAVPER